MAGAAYFCAAAAYRCGCGLVRIFTAEENAQSLHCLIPEAVLSTYGKNLDTAKLIEHLKWADAVVLGPGIGTSANARKMLHTVLQNAAVPMLLDADALNLLSEETDLLLRAHTEMVVTPHLGEMARLTGDLVSLIQTRLFETAQEFARQYDVVCVLKDFHTVTAVPYGLNFLNLSGNHGMATAGSGDVLSGIIGAYLAAGIPASLAAPLGVYVHGLAGDYARAVKGAAALMAGDILEGLVTLSGKVDIKNGTE
jgi:NAD(P)H-hydrate epimerase